MNNKIIVLILTLCLTTTLQAAWVEVELVDIRAFTKHSAHYIAVKDFANPNSCKSAGLLALYRDDADNWKMVHSLLMAGFVSGKRIKVRTSGCDGNFTKIDGALLIK